MLEISMSLQKQYLTSILKSTHACDCLIGLTHFVLNIWIEFSISLVCNILLL